MNIYDIKNELRSVDTSASMMESIMRGFGYIFEADQQNASGKQQIEYNIQPYGNAKHGSKNGGYKIDFAGGTPDLFVKVAPYGSLDDMYNLASMDNSGITPGAFTRIILDHFKKEASKSKTPETAGLLLRDANNMMGNLVWQELSRLAENPESKEFNSLYNKDKIVNYVHKNLAQSAPQQQQQKPQQQQQPQQPQQQANTSNGNVKQELLKDANDRWNAKPGTAQQNQNAPQPSGDWEIEFNTGNGQAKYVVSKGDAWYILPAIVDKNQIYNMQKNAQAEKADVNNHAVRNVFVTELTANAKTAIANGSLSKDDVTKIIDKVTKAEIDRLSKQYGAGLFKVQPQKANGQKVVDKKESAKQGQPGQYVAGIDFNKGGIGPFVQLFPTRKTIKLGWRQVQDNKAKQFNSVASKKNYTAVILKKVPGITQEQAAACAQQITDELAAYLTKKGYKDNSKLTSEQTKANNDQLKQQSSAKKSTKDTKGQSGTINGKQSAGSASQASNAKMSQAEYESKQTQLTGTINYIKNKSKKDLGNNWDDPKVDSAMNSIDKMLHNINTVYNHDENNSMLDTESIKRINGLITMISEYKQIDGSKNGESKKKCKANIMYYINEFLPKVKMAERPSAKPVSKGNEDIKNRH